MAQRINWYGKEGVFLSNEEASAAHEAIALGRSIILSGESMSPRASETFDRGIAALKPDEKA